MADTLKPRDAADVQRALAWTVAEGKALEIVGGGSKRGIGRAAQWDMTLDLSALRGVTLYEPEELVLSARAGTPLAEIEVLLASKGQMLAFEPMDYGPIFGAPGGQATIGGVLASNLSGPRRIKSGAARDHFLGVTAVSGRGETFKSGGRVVKNVTGYDLCKLLAGSWGTLAAMTDVTIKVLPAAETEETLLVFGLEERAAVKVMSAALGSSADVSGAAYLPAQIARRTDLPALSAVSGSITALRLEGVAPSIAHRREILKALNQASEIGSLAETDSRRLWGIVRDAVPFGAWHGSDRPLWRISTAPMSAPEVVDSLRDVDAEFFLDWGGGLIWVRLGASDDAGADRIATAIGRAGGHATLIRASASLRATIPVFPVEPPALAALTRRIKESFDPKGVLNAGRMYPGV